MIDRIRTYEYPDGSIQRVQSVMLDNFEALDFFAPVPSLKAYAAFCDIYHRFLIPAAPYIFGHMAMFHLGSRDEVADTQEGSNESAQSSLKETAENNRSSEQNETTKILSHLKNTIANLYNATCVSRYGFVDDPLCQLTILFKENVRISKDGAHFKNSQVGRIYETLSENRMLQVESGKRNSTHMIPIGLKTGYMSTSEETSALKVNSSFFIMDRFDLASVYDSVGTPIGLMVKNGEILNPPLYKREALLVRANGRAEIAVPALETLNICINENTYRHAENCLIYTRPEYKKTPTPTSADATDLVIIGRRIMAVHKIAANNSKNQKRADRHTDIPASGFVMRILDIRNEKRKPNPGDAVTYAGLENVVFGLQVGNSILRNGAETKTFISPFYNIRRPFRTPFPPSLYPLDFENARAARIALGSDREGKPVILWAEGAGKVAYEKGVDSAGATLAEMGRYCLDAGMINAIHLDGGGSAQILLNNKRKLKISDRQAADNSELERAVPAGLIIR